MQPGDEVSNDKLFKTALCFFLRDFVELVDPEIAAALDLEAPSFLPPELFVDFRKHGHVEPDVVAKVRTREGEPRLLLVHVEVEGEFREQIDARMRRYALHLELVFGLPVVSAALFLKGGPEGAELRHVRTVIGGRELSRTSYLAFGLSRSLAEEYVDRPQPLAAALAALMRSRVWDKVEKKLYCLKAVSRVVLPVDRQYVLAEIVESQIELDVEEEKRYEELVRERGKEVQEMAVTWEEALAEREALGIAKGKARLQEEMAATWEEALAAREALGRAKMQEELAATWEEALANREAKGQLAATRQAIKLVARHCFGSLPAGFEEKLEAIDDLGRLHEILEQVPDARKAEELLM